MKKWQREIIDDIYAFCNRIGGTGDMTAISTKRLMACTQANYQVCRIIAAAFYDEDKKMAEKLCNEFDLLTRWSFPDKMGRLSEEEKEANKRLEKIAEENGLKIFFTR